jgi:hypothetical protein
MLVLSYLLPDPEADVGEGSLSLPEKFFFFVLELVGINESESSWSPFFNASHFF